MWALSNVLYGICLGKLGWIYNDAFLSPQHILFCIIDSECKSRDVLQSYFDLLGELMKFNLLAFKRFNKYVDTEEKVTFIKDCNSSKQLTEPIGWK